VGQAPEFFYLTYEGLGSSTDSLDWQAIPGAQIDFTVTENSTLTIVFTGEVAAPSEAQMWLRPQVDDQNTSPIDVVFARSANWGTHSATFIETGITPGSHQVEIQWRSWQGTVFIEAWTLIVYAYPVSE
jgi:hypothetical protein